MMRRLMYLCERVRCFEQRQYNKRKRKRLKSEDFTIISSNCNGSFMYYDMGLKYRSPTVNLSLGMDDFVKMVENLRWYMQQEIVEWKEEGQRFPLGMLGDLKINFVHYDTFAEGVEKWEERKKRINWDNIFIVGTARECSYDTIARFDRLPYENKVIFTNVEYPEFSSAFYIKGFEREKQLGVLIDYRKRLLRRRYLDDFDYVAFLNGLGLRYAGRGRHWKSK